MKSGFEQLDWPGRSALPARWSAVALTALLLLAFVACGAGCAALRLPRVSLPSGGMLQGVEATAPKDTGKPAVVQSAGEESRIALPAGSTITVTRTEAQPATDHAPARPAYEVREIRLASDSAWYERAQRIAANTGTVDTSVALRRIDAAERRWLLFTAIGSALGGLLCMQLIPAWPGIARGLFAAAALAFAAWKFAEVPSWAFVVAAGLGLLGAFYYKRGEIDANRNGIPDALEGKTT